MHEALVRRAQKGDEAAFEILTRDAGHRSMAIAGGILHDRGAAERAVEAAFVVAWRTIPRLRKPNRFEPWLKGLVLQESARARGTIRRLGTGPSPAEPAFGGPALMSEAALEAIARRVARTRQVSERPLFEGRLPVELVLLCAALAASVVASGRVPVSPEIDRPGIVETPARPPPTDEADTTVRVGDVVLAQDFREPMSFTVPRLADRDSGTVVVERFSRNSIAVRSGTSVIEINSGTTLPADLCRHRRGSAKNSLKSDTSFASWIRRSTGVEVIRTGSFPIDTGAVQWIDITTNRTCRSSFFVGPSEQHRLLLVPGRDDRLLVMTGRGSPSVETLARAAVKLAASMRFD